MKSIWLYLFVIIANNVIVAFVALIYLRRRSRVREENRRKSALAHANGLIDTLVPEYVSIGRNFISAPNSVILAHDASTLPFTGKYRILHTRIGKNVFLGANAVILPGVKIGDNVIIGAGSIVTHDVASDVVVAGNPARILMTLESYLEKHKDDLVELSFLHTSKSNSESK
jgi:acetyltransferase-like isoleucine patch superfamily enzyme